MTKLTPSNLCKCKKCGKLKPVFDFITGRDLKMRVTYSQYCKSCRVVIAKDAAKRKKQDVNPTGTK